MEKKFKVRVYYRIHPGDLVDCTEVRWIENNSHSRKGFYNK